LKLHHAGILTEEKLDKKIQQDIGLGKSEILSKNTKKTKQNGHVAI